MASVHQALQPLAQHLLRPRWPGRARRGGASPRAGSAPGRIALGLGSHLGVEALELVPAVGVGVVQVEVDAVAVAGPAPVALGPDGVGRALGGRPVLVEQVACRNEAKASRRRGAAGASSAPDRRVRRPLDPRRRSRQASPVVAAPDRELLDGASRPGAARRTRRRAAPASERLAELLVGVGHAVQPVANDLPLLRRRRRRHVEHVPELLHRGGDVVQHPQVLVAVVDRQRSLRAARAGGGRTGGRGCRPPPLPPLPVEPASSESVRRTSSARASWPSGE